MYILSIMYVLPITGILSTYILMAPIGAAGAHRTGVEFLIRALQTTCAGP